MIVLPVSLAAAAAIAILNIWLSARVVQARRGTEVTVGDGGQEPILRRMRAHSNFAENAPIFLILLALVELAGADKTILMAAALLFLVARIAHGFGMDGGSLVRWRKLGMTASTVLLLAVAGFAAFIAAQPEESSVRVETELVQPLG